MPKRTRKATQTTQRKAAPRKPKHEPRLLQGPGPRPRRTSDEMIALGDDVRKNRSTADLQGPFGVDVCEDPEDDRRNRELAEKIRKLVRQYKNQDGKQTFVIGWRLYPNAHHPRFGGEDNTCGCGCGCGG